MRKLIPLIVITILAGAIYTAFGIYSYTPVKPDPLQFDVKRPDPKEIRAKIEKKQKKMEISEQLETKKEKIMSRIEAALKKYESFVDTTGQPASRTLQALYKLMRNSQLPVFYPDLASADRQGTLKFNELALGEAKTGRIRNKADNTLTCNSARGTAYNILVGSRTKNNLSCGMKPVTPGDVRVYIAGPDDDRIEDARGHTIINAGSGDDSVTTGPGSALIYVEAGWGKDTLNVSCQGAEMDPSRFPDEMPAPWKYKYANFIIFSPGISPEDIVYKDGIVRHRNTNDKLIIDQNCFSYVFADDLRRP